MQPLLVDEGLPGSVAQALSTLGLAAHAVGNPGAPAKGSGDDVNCQWCVNNAAVLVTNDRGKKDPLILNMLAQLGVDAIFVHSDLRDGPAYRLARALLNSEGNMDKLAAGPSHIRHRLRVRGGLEKR